jgi:TonB family protein
MRRNLFLSITVCVLLAGAAACGEDLQDHLDAAYKNKIYILRHPIARESQHYDSTGQLLNSASEGPWTLYGALEIKSASLSTSQLRLTANRLVYTYDEAKKDLLPKRVKWDRAKVTIDVALSHPLATLEEADGILHRIFVFSESELLETAPDYWLPFLRKQAATTTPAPVTDGSKEANKDTAEVVERVHPPQVTAPKPVHTPEPEYNEFAREFRMRGIVVVSIIVDKNGAVMRPQIVRPIGFGLDEQAITAVRGWKFKPSLRDGKPVAVEMAVEVSFNIG